jgi:hypothetical protein
LIMTIHELTLNIIFAVFVFVSKRKRNTEEQNDGYIVKDPRIFHVVS